MRPTGQNSLGLGSKPEKNRGLGGASILMDRICYPKHQSHKCEELLVDSWQKISAQLMRWVICKEQSLSDSSLRIQFLSNTQFIATWENSNTTYVSFSKNIEMKVLQNSGFLKFSTPHHHSLDMYSQSTAELDSSGRDGATACPVFCCPNAATLITVSPSDLTLVFLLLACRLAESPGQLEGGTTAWMFTFPPITEG